MNPSPGRDPMAMLGGFRFLQLAALGAYLIFFPVYLVERGLSLEQVGLVVTASVAVQLFAGILWGVLADRRGRTVPFLLQALAVWAASVFVLPFLSSFTQFLALGVCRSLFAPMMEGLITTNLFKGAREDGRGAAYSGFAVWGAMGWALGVSLGGLVTRWAGTAGAFYLAGILFVGAAFAASRIPEPTEPVIDPRARRTIWTSLGLLRDRRVLWLLGASLPLIISLNATSQFFPVRLREVGGTSFLIGLTYMIPSLLEIPVFLGVGGRSDRWGSRKPLLLWAAGVYMAIYLLIYALSDPWKLLLGYALLEPLAWAPFVTGAFTLVAELVPRKNWATGQTLFSLWLWSVGGILGPAFGGIIAQRWGLNALFLVLALGALLSGVLFTGLPGREGPRRPPGQGSP